MASRALCRAAAVVVGLTGCGTSETFLEFQGEGCERLEFFADADGDGFGDLSHGIEACEAPPGYVAARPEGSDCDDRAPGVHPLAVEICGGADEDCDGLVDDADPDLSVEGTLTVYADLDGDGFGDPAAQGHACVLPLDASLSGADCDDADDGVHPDATEICDGQERDEDCDGLVDDEDPDLDPATLLDWAPDSDGDGYGDETGGVLTTCAAPGTAWSTRLGDCDDADDTAWPGATERCDGRDTDCDGDASDAGMATFLGASGGHQDLSAALSAGGPGDPVHYELGQDGVLQICTATWDLLLAIDGVDVELRGHGEVVLDAGGAGTVVSATNSTLSLSGLTLTGGSATEGAGLYLEDTDFDLQGVGIDGGSATRGGGVAVVGASEGSLVDLRITGAEASGDGGGLWLDTGVVVDAAGLDVRLSGAENGGGIALAPGAALGLADVHLEGNGATAWGGGLYVDGAQLQGVGLVFLGNTAATGGGAAMVDTVVRLEGGMWSQNAAESGGGVALSLSGAGDEVELVEVDFTGNEPDDLVDLVNDTSHELGSGASVGCTAEGCE